MSALDSAPLPRPTRAVGRPALIDSQAIFNAALAIGLDQFTMKAVADRLGVGISTLYQHVKNRDEVVRLAALRQALTRTPPEDSGQHWAELAVAYAEDLLNTLVSQPQLIVELIKGGLGPRVEADVLEHFLTAMQEHGFAAEEALRLYRSIGMVTIGGAVGILNIASAKVIGASHRVQISQLLSERGSAELPLIRQAINEYQREDVQVWLTALHELLAGVAAARGDALPASINALRHVSPAIAAVLQTPGLFQPKAASSGF